MWGQLTRSLLVKVLLNLVCTNPVALKFCSYACQLRPASDFCGTGKSGDSFMCSIFEQYLSCSNFKSRCQYCCLLQWQQLDRSLQLACCSISIHLQWNTVRSSSLHLSESEQSIACTPGTVVFCTSNRIWLNSALQSHLVWFQNPLWCCAEAKLQNYSSFSLWLL